MARPEQFITISRQHGKTCFQAALRQARERGYLDGLADGYNQALQEHCGRRHLLGEAVLSLVALVAVTLLLASRAGVI